MSEEPWEGNPGAWRGEPPHPYAQAMTDLVGAVERLGDAFSAFCAVVRESEDAENRKMLAEVYGCPPELVDDVIRVRTTDARREP